MPATRLADVADVSKQHDEGAVVEHIQWLEAFTDKSRTSEFCADTDPAGNFESNSSTGHTEYSDRLRAIALRKEGMEKAEIAEAIGRSAKFVQTWWKKDPKEVPKPAGVHAFLKTEFWRDIQIVRGFAKGTGVYDTALTAIDWIDQMADGMAFKDGGSRLKYDKEGRMRPNGSQYSKEGVLPGMVPQLDKVMQKMLNEQGIDDRVLKRPGMLWYPDGNSSAIPHRHEAWTALMSFGQPRILTIDKHPVLLRDGDLILFGTQRHGVPKMCTQDGTFDQYGGRMSVVFFYMPTGQQAAGAEPWKAIMDDAPSRKMVAMQKDVSLSTASNLEVLRSGPHGPSIVQLTSLGFSEDEVVACLQAVAFDLEKAATILLDGGAKALMVADRDSMATSALWSAMNREAQRSALYKKLSELQSADRSGAQPSQCSHNEQEDDAALAQRLQQEEDSQQCSTGPEGWEERAILEQLEEIDRIEQAETGNSVLKEQFAQYEEMLVAEDAEDWDGRGDLMVRNWRRDRLHIEQQEPSIVYSIGCKSELKERTFFELLQLQSIRVLYDLRANPERGGAPFLEPHQLETCCKARGLHYRNVELGRESAYGILKHLREDQGRNTLAELVWHARRKHTAFLGADADWRADHRCAIGARLREAGHQVKHITHGGSLEEQPLEFEIPDHISGEEARLRMLEKKRQSGEDDRKHKSAVSRSSEVVAQKLTQPTKEIDAAAELRKANTQRELCNVQRRLADLQRRSEGSDAKAGLGPKLLNVNKWVKAQAAEQQANLAAGKTKDGKDKLAKENASERSQAGAGTSSSSMSMHTTSMQEHVVQAAGASSHSGAQESGPTQPAELAPESILIECRGCEKTLPWEELVDFDGLCSSCAVTATESSNLLDAAGSLTENEALVGPAAGDARCMPEAVIPECEHEAQPDKPRSNWRASRSQKGRAAAASAATDRV